MTSKTRVSVFTVGILTVVGLGLGDFACSGSDSTTPTGPGAWGGSAATGGAANTGGTTATATGGTHAATGGTVASAPGGTNAVATGGTVAAATGGTVAIATGGKPATGGTNAVTTGGTAPTATGGTVAGTTGGTSAGTTGGTNAVSTGGTSPGTTGGTSAGDTGGSSAAMTGGTSAGTTGGGTSTTSCSTFTAPALPTGGVLCSAPPLTAAGYAPAKGGVCIATDTQVCYSTCGPAKMGYKTETCGTTYPSTYTESTCIFPGSDYSCFKIPSTYNSACPAVPQASTSCTAVGAGVVCGPTYLTNGGTVAAAGYCICNNNGTTLTFSCASAASWPCPNSAGCT